MEFKLTIGVDVSKEWLNYCIYNANFEILAEGQIDNNDAAILSFIKRLKETYLEAFQEMMLILEFTGIYVKPLVRTWLLHSPMVAITPASKVSLALGGNQGFDEKTDAMDARRLAEYGFRFADKLTTWEHKDPILVELQALQRSRERLNKAYNLLAVPVNESKGFDVATLTKKISASAKSSIKALKNDIKNVEKKLRQLIQKSEWLSNLYSLLTSVEGVGPVIAIETIVATQAFVKYRPRSVAVVPKEKQSGKFSRKQRIGKRGNKKMKTLLTMGATALIRSKSELGLYYNRKIEEGKPHFSVINAMRNKMILRMFAVVRNQSMYIKNLNMNLE